MTGTAVRAELSVVVILGGVTGKTIGGCTLEHTVGVTRFTVGVRVRPCQWEAGIAVIEGGVFPVFRVMTRRADRPELTLMCII